MVSPVDGLILLLLCAGLLALIPLRARTPRAFPVVTATLLVVNTALFLLTQDDTGNLRRDIALAWGLTPRMSSPLALLTAPFLHGTWLHLLSNLSGLWLFGPHVEEALGRLEFLLFYLGCAIAAGLLHTVIAVAFLPVAATMPMVGASGAIFGVLGLFVVRFYRARLRLLLLFDVPATWGIGVFFALQLAAGLISLADGGRTTTTANWAHIGGFVFGILLALWLRLRDDGRREYTREDAEAAAASGDLDQAAGYYRQLVTERPEDAAAQISLARLCLGIGQPEASFRHYQDALTLLLRQENLPAAARLYEEMRMQWERLELSAALLARIASACEETHRIALAQQALSDLCLQHGGTRDAELALLRLGKLHLRRLEQPQSAGSIFQEFLRLYPQSEWRQHAQQLLREAENTGAVWQGLPPPPPPPSTPGTG